MEIVFLLALSTDAFLTPRLSTQRAKDATRGRFVLFCFVLLFDPLGSLFV